jgi:hypothetical protein
VNGIPDDHKISVLMERVDHIARSIDDLRPLLTIIVQVQEKLNNQENSIKSLGALAESRGAMFHQVDKRVLVLERWHRFMLAIPALVLTICIWFGGYAKSYIAAIEAFQKETSQRVSALEFIINAPSYEKLMSVDKEPDK